MFNEEEKKLLINLCYQKAKDMQDTRDSIAKETAEEMFERLGDDKDFLFLKSKKIKKHLCKIGESIDYAY